MKRILVVALAMILLVSLVQTQGGTGYFTGFKNTGKTVFGTPVALVGASGAQTLKAGTVFQVSGTNTITSITTGAADKGRLLIFILSSTTSFTDGSNLKMAGNFSGSADDVIVFIGDGTNWYEVSRSAN